jgi:hypothetical protein
MTKTTKTTTGTAFTGTAFNKHGKAVRCTVPTNDVTWECRRCGAHVTADKCTSRIGEHADCNACTDRGFVIGSSKASRALYGR